MTTENHCEDCCCAQSWKALGITEYDGKSIPEHIQALQSALTASECARVEKDKALLQISEYWNGAEGSAVDAAEACSDIAKQALSSTTPNSMEKELEELRDKNKDLTAKLERSEAASESLKIQLLCWIATFSKYESWKANKADASDYPEQVLKDYRECASVTTPNSVAQELEEQKKRISELERIMREMPEPDRYDGPAPGESITKYTEAMRAAMKPSDATIAKGAGGEE